MDGDPGPGALDGLSARLEAVEDRVRLIEGRVTELERSGRGFLRALNRLGDALAATHDRPAMLSAVLETSALFVGASAGVFYGVVGGAQRLRPLAAFGAAGDPETLAELQAGEGVAGSAVASHAVVVWPGGAVAASPNEPGCETAVAVPIHSGGRPFGVLALYGLSSDRPFTADDVESLASLTRQVETAIENSFLFEEAARQSLTDGLTSLWNRRQFDLRLAGEYQRGVRFHEAFSVALLDLDRLKAVNDTYGHQAGDALLIEIAHRLSAGIREVDLAARFGGDEFALLLPSTGVAGALRLAEKVRSSIADVAVELNDRGDSVRATVSIGVAAYPEHGADSRQLMGAADAALYRAKAAGGNRVLHAQVSP